MATVGKAIDEPRTSDDAAPRTARDLTAWIERRVADGRLAPGQRLDPVRVAATRFGLAPNTVAASYRRLQERGLLRGEGRRGTFVAERPASRRPDPSPLGPDLVDLASGNPDPRLLPPLGPALATIDGGHTLYGTPPIDPELVRALTTDLGAGIGPLLPPEDLVRPGDDRPGPGFALVAGALDGIERVLEARLRPGDRVAVEDPGYTAVLDLLAARNHPVVPVALDRRGMRPDGLAAALADGVAAVVITPRAQNPTGVALDAERAAELAGLLAGHADVLVVEDDHAGPAAGVAHHRVAGPSLARWAIVRSLAKAFGPDLRLATVAGDRTTVDRVADRLLLGPGWVSHLLQRTATALLSDEGMGELLARNAGIYAERRNAVIDRLARAGIEAVGASGLNVWVPVDDEAAVVAGMQQRGWAIRSGAGFRSASPPAVRLSIGGSDPGVLAEATDALVEVLSGGSRHRWA